MFRKYNHLFYCLVSTVLNRGYYLRCHWENICNVKFERQMQKSLFRKNWTFTSWKQKRKTGDRKKKNWELASFVCMCDCELWSEQLKSSKQKQDMSREATNLTKDTYKEGNWKRRKVRSSLVTHEWPNYSNFLFFSYRL